MAIRCSSLTFICISIAVPKPRRRHVGAEFRYSEYRPALKSESTEKPKKSPLVSQFHFSRRKKKQRGKVPSKLPAFLTALLYSVLVCRENEKSFVNNGMPSWAPAVEET